VRDAVKKAPPKDLPKPGKFRLAGENGAAAEAKEGGA
jgi:large subunit ribosomal protein L3